MTDDPDYRSYLDLKTQMHERAEEETRKRHEEFRHRKQLEDARRQLADDARLRAMMVEVIEEQMARLYVPNFVASLEKLAEGLAEGFGGESGIGLREAKIEMRKYADDATKRLRKDLVSKLIPMEAELRELIDAREKSVGEFVCELLVKAMRADALASGDAEVAEFQAALKQAIGKAVKRSTNGHDNAQH